MKGFSKCTPTDSERGKTYANGDIVKNVGLTKRNGVVELISVFTRMRVYGFEFRG